MDRIPWRSIGIGFPFHENIQEARMRFPILERRVAHLVSSMSALLFLLIMLIPPSPEPAHAIPAFARKYGLPCSACHVAWPLLNNFGQVFRDNGYQLMNDRDSPIWQNPSYFPISFRITPNWHRESTTNQQFDTGNGTLTQAGFDLSGMDLWSGGTLYKNISFILLPSSDST